MYNIYIYILRVWDVLWVFIAGFLNHHFGRQIFSLFNGSTVGLPPKKVQKPHLKDAAAASPTCIVGEAWVGGGLCHEIATLVAIPGIGPTSTHDRSIWRGRWRLTLGSTPFSASLTQDHASAKRTKGRRKWLQSWAVSLICKTKSPGPWMLMIWFGTPPTVW